MPAARSSDAHGAACEIVPAARGIVIRVPLTRTDLRLHALASTLFPPTTLGRALTRLGFVQADPIRSPARAQDLILRHRVANYRAGDLDRHYRKLHLEEDFLYAYGYMPSATWQLLHPRAARTLQPVEQSILDWVAAHKHAHPRALEQHFGNSREVNAWGGYSKATTRTLERLHYLGLLRIAGRSNGIKLYQATAVQHDPLPPAIRLQQLVLRIAHLLAPLSETSLRAVLQHLHHAAPHLPGRKGAVAALLASGALDAATVDGIRYVWPAGRKPRTPTADTVRFLAPFDPVVWDRGRFEHLWQWPYRFEAYTPAPKRRFGYYALPLLWRTDILGWVNVTPGTNGPNIVPGYVKGRAPRDSAFRHAFEAEAERLKLFLQPRS